MDDRKMLVIKPELHKQLKQHCKSNGLIMSSFVELAVRRALEGGNNERDLRSEL
jgi:hypothetical protein